VVLDLDSADNDRQAHCC